MGGEDAAPCRHRGAPPDEVVARVSQIIADLAGDSEFLRSRGMTPDEYRLALPVAIEKLRGSAAASNADRRGFLTSFFTHLAEAGVITNFEVPVYGKETVYKLVVPGVGLVAIVQKGCPDGAHSSTAWTIPEWADETYLWWICSALGSEPGVHVCKGVNRLRKRFFSDAAGALDGIIFHNELCGTDTRPCPKMANSILVAGKRIPPPCIWVMPERQAGLSRFNWRGERIRKFPVSLLSAFGIALRETGSFTGHVGFQEKGNGTRTTIASRYGQGRTTIFRS